MNFSISCTIGDFPFNNALADLETSINVMSYHTFKKLGLGEPKLLGCALVWRIKWLDILEELLKLYL